MSTQTNERNRLHLQFGHIRRIVAEYYEIPVPSLIARDRSEPLATIRQIAMAFCMKVPGATKSAVARSFARNDHTTIAHAERSVQEKCAVDKALAAERREIAARVEKLLIQPS